MPFELKDIAENEQHLDHIAESYADKYPDQIEAFESSALQNVIGESVSAMDVVALGQQLDQFNNYARWIQESHGDMSSLGVMPQVALDVITAATGNSILPLLCSIQPMTEEHGIVYYKQIRAAQAAGGYDAGDVISDPLSRDNLGDGSLGAQRKQEELTTTTDTTTTYSGTTAANPVRPYMFEVNIAGIGNGKDNGKGKILGFGFSGTIDYETGAWELTFATNPGGDVSIQAIYDVDVDSADSLDKIEGSLISKDTRAEIWALGADVGTFANFAFQQRFGRSASDEVAQDLSDEMTRILNTQAIKRMVNQLVGTTTWNKGTPSGVSYAEHKLTFVDALAEAEGTMHNNSGIGAVNRIIGGRSACATLAGMPGFQRAAVTPTTSVAVFGTLDGIPVIRATDVMDSNKLALVGNPDNYFNAPLGYSPFMPMMMTNTVQNPNNPFRQTQAAGIWAGMTNLNSNLTTELVIDPSAAS